MATRFTGPVAAVSSNGKPPLHPNSKFILKKSEVRPIENEEEINEKKVAARMLAAFSIYTDAVVLSHGSAIPREELKKDRLDKPYFAKIDKSNDVNHLTSEFESLSINLLKRRILEKAFLCWKLDTFEKKINKLAAIAAREMDIGLFAAIPSANVITAGAARPSGALGRTSNATRESSHQLRSSRVRNTGGGRRSFNRMLSPIFQSNRKQAFEEWEMDQNLDMSQKIQTIASLRKMVQSTPRVNEHRVRMGVDGKHKLNIARYKNVGSAMHHQQQQQQQHPQPLQQHHHSHLFAQNLDERMGLDDIGARVSSGELSKKSSSSSLINEKNGKIVKRHSWAGTPLGSFFNAVSKVTSSSSIRRVKTATNETGKRKRFSFSIMSSSKTTKDRNDIDKTKKTKEVVDPAKDNTTTIEQTTKRVSSRKSVFFRD